MAIKGFTSCLSLIYLISRLATETERRERLKSSFLYCYNNGICVYVYTTVSCLSLSLFELHLGSPFIGKEPSLGFALAELVSYWPEVLDQMLHLASS